MERVSRICYERNKIKIRRGVIWYLLRFSSFHWWRCEGRAEGHATTDAQTNHEVTKSLRTQSLQKHFGLVKYLKSLLVIWLSCRHNCPTFRLQKHVGRVRKSWSRPSHLPQWSLRADGGYLMYLHCKCLGKGLPVSLREVPKTPLFLSVFSFVRYIATCSECNPTKTTIP